jgi:hypothetical protein
MLPKMALIFKPYIKGFAACEALKFFYMPSGPLDPPLRSEDAVYAYESQADGIAADTGAHPTQHGTVWPNDD